MIAVLLLPLGKEISKETIHSFLKIQISINIKIPHFTAHLNKYVNRSRKEWDTTLVSSLI